MASSLPFVIKSSKDLASATSDGVVVVSWPNATLLKELSSTINEAASVDEAFHTQVSVLKAPGVPGGRIIYSPTGPIDPDYEDVRILSTAAVNGIQRALKAGIKKPALFIPENSIFPNSDLVILLAALEALYVPLQWKEDLPEKAKHIVRLEVISSNPKIDDIVKLAEKIENGRIVARDIGGSDPERMAPPKVEQYVENVFKNSNIEVKSISNSATLAKEYPLFQAVNRCAEHVERHKGRIIFLTYTPNSAVEKTIMLVGKGVTYDTGGADIKAGGHMQGMSRDKCGAAAVAGFMKVVSLLAPQNVKVVAAMCMVRNSVGSDCYVSDEIIVARSGARVRIGNTDAEGRMAMADALCEFKDLAKKEVNPHLYTIATLTGHACLAAGPGYSIVMDNGPARRKNHAYTLQKHSEVIGDPFEVSIVRREDIAAHRDKGLGVDVLQCNNEPSSRTPRGHQTPAGFLLLASGLIENGSGSETPLCYSHLDIASSAGEIPNEATGAPILALAKMLLM